jgi:hypothetical protein
MTARPGATASHQLQRNAGERVEASQDVHLMPPAPTAATNALDARAACSEQAWPR